MLDAPHALENAYRRAGSHRRQRHDRRHELGDHRAVRALLGVDPPHHAQHEPAILQDGQLLAEMPSL